MGKEGEPRRQKVETPVFSSWDIDKTIRLGKERERLGVRGQAISFLEELQVRKVEIEVLENLVSKGSLPPSRLREYRFLFDLFASTPDRNAPLKKEIEKLRKEKEAQDRAQARKRAEAKAKRVRKEKQKAKKEKSRVAKKKEVKTVKKKEARRVTYVLPDGKKVRGKVGIVLKELDERGIGVASDDLAVFTGLSRAKVVRLVGYARKNVLPGTGLEIKSVVFDPEKGEGKIVDSETKIKVGQRVSYLLSRPEDREERPVVATPEAPLGKSPELANPSGMEN